MSLASKGVPKSENMKRKLKGNKNALGAQYIRNRYKIISPDNDIFIVSGHKELEIYVPHWTVLITKKNGGPIKAGKYKGWSAYLL